MQKNSSFLVSRGSANNSLARGDSNEGQQRGNLLPRQGKESRRSRHRCFEQGIEAGRV
jgi:hypothetical protein